jgi:hypothetical protein
MEHFNKYFQQFIEFCRTSLTVTTAQTIAWIGLVLIHAATIPTILSVMTGLNDKLPPVDMVLFVYGGLALFFVRAAVLKDMINIVTIGVGFVIHTILLSLLIFK